MYVYSFYHLVGDSVYFQNLMYIVNEDSRFVQLVLVLSNSSSTDVTIKVNDIGGTAISESTNINVSTFLQCIIL